MKKVIRKGLALALAAVLALGCCATAFAADGDTEDDAPKASTIQMEVTFGQSEAREMLALINDFRTGDDAWYWKNNQTQEVFRPVLDELTYDYTLEKAAMQRAAEIALYFSYNHIRPSGANCVSVITDAGLNGRWLNYGENIAMATTGEQAFNLWLEEDQPYAGQGHRRNMLGAYNAVGIGHVYYNGVHYWVQEFAMLFPNYINTTPTPAVDGQQTVDVVVRNDKISDVLLTPQPDSLTLEVGETADLPELGIDLRMDLSPRKSNPVTAEVQWEAASDGIVELSEGKLTAKSVGTTNLTATVLGKSTTIPVTVNAVSLANANVSLDQDSWSYTGKPITPAVTVLQNGNTLVEGTDYTVAYQNNTEEGTGTVIVTGTGSYSGTVTKDFTITPCQHVWDQGEVTQAATCTQEGVKTYTCTNCGQPRTEAVPATGHTEVAYPAEEATCTAEGHAAGTRCAVCGAILSGGEATPALGHSYDGGKITKPPTCEEEGVKTFACTRCGETRTEAVPATGHSYDAGKVTQAASCTVDGVMTFTCTVCGDSYTQAIPATGHSFGPWETVQSPSCTDEGSEQRTCTVCGYAEARNLEATGHSWEDHYTVDQPATCTSDGSQSIHCANCQAVKDAQVIPATGHSWDAGKVTQEATCTEPGVRTYTCTACGATQTEAIPVLGHSYDAGKITREPTCTEDGVITYTCERCGATLKDPVDAQGHRWDQGQVTTEPTCTVEGVKTYTCTVCGATKTEVVPATGHSYGDRWYSDENGHWQVCTLCGQATDPVEHTLQWLTDTAPTATEAGSRHQECTVCGYQGQAEAIPATGTTGGDDMGNTGDVAPDGDSDNGGSTGGAVQVGNAGTQDNTGTTGDADHTGSADSTGATGSQDGAGDTSNTGDAVNMAQTDSGAQDQTGGTATAATGKTAPKTGDESNVVLCLALLTLSLGTVACVALYSRKPKG